MKVADVLKRENNNLDLVRIIVATMVIWCHSFMRSQNVDPIADFLKILGTGELGVDIFFFVSGLLVANSIIKKQSISKFLTARFFRIFPALIFLLLLTAFVIGPIVTELPLRDYFLNSQTIKYFVGNSILQMQYILPGVFVANGIPSNVNGALWTLPFEIVCYISLLGCFFLIGKKTRIAVILICTIVLICMLPTESLMTLSGLPYIGVIRYAIACFAVGVFFAIYQEKINIDFKLVFAVSLLCLFFWRWHNVISILFPVAVSLFFLFFSADKFVLKLKMKHDVSYGLYIWHSLIIELIIYFFGSMNGYLLFLLTFISTYFIAFVSSFLVEERSMVYGSKLGNKMNNSSYNYEKIWILFIILLIVVILAKIH